MATAIKKVNMITQIVQLKTNCSTLEKQKASTVSFPHPSPPQIPRNQSDQPGGGHPLALLRGLRTPFFLDRHVLIASLLHNAK